MISVAACAQATARMEVTARVVAGSTVSAPATQVNMIAADSSAVNMDLDFPVLSLKTSSGTGVLVSMANIPDLTNDDGSLLKMNDLKLVALPTVNGGVAYNLKGKSVSARKLSGLYKGNLTAVVEYF